MELLFLIKQIISCILFFMKLTKDTKKTIDTIMNLLLINSSELNTTIVCKEQSGGTEGQPQDQMSQQEPVKSIEEQRENTKTNLENAAEAVSKSFNKVEETQQTYKTAKTELKQSQKRLDKLNKLKSLSEQDKQKKNKLINDIQTKSQELVGLKQKRDNATAVFKSNKQKQFTARINDVELSNKEFEENNPHINKLFSDGPIQGIYRLLKHIANIIAKVFNNIIVYFYQKSVMTLLPFIMTMSFSFSFLKYLFQKVKSE